MLWRYTALVSFPVLSFFRVFVRQREGGLARAGEPKVAVTTVRLSQCQIQEREARRGAWWFFGDYGPCESFMNTPRCGCEPRAFGLKDRRSCHGDAAAASIRNRNKDSDSCVTLEDDGNVQSFEHSRVLGQR